MKENKNGKIENIKINGYSERRFTFGAFALGTWPEPLAKIYPLKRSPGGVFLITRRTELSSGNGVHKLLHAGKSDNLIFLPETHRMFDDWIAEGANVLAIRYALTGTERARIVGDLVDAFDPPYNRGERRLQRRQKFSPSEEQTALPYGVVWRPGQVLYTQDPAFQKLNPNQPRHKPV